MESYSITIADPAHVAGIAAARAAYNAGREEGAPELATNEQYVQFVMAKAAESYARQYGAA